jgi:transcriptional regulator with XRE-family HTH domain
MGDIIGRVNRPRNLLPTGAAAPDADEDEDEDEDDAATFGVWLGQARVGKGWSVPELAKRAHVSMPTVYAIEAGRIANPRDQTRRKLESALGQTMDAEVAAEVERQASVEGIGELVDFNPHDADDIPAEPGVYVLYDISQRPIYVGQGASIRTRLKDHEQKFWFKRPIVETGAYVVVRDDGFRQQIESLLIRFLKSNAVLNKQNVDRRN